MKVRLFCKNIVLFTIALDVILTSELHFLYYGITVSMASIHPLMVLLALAFIIRSVYYNLQRDVAVAS